MKTNWPAYRLALLILAGLACAASTPRAAAAAPPSSAVQIEAQVSALQVRIEAKADVAFAYTTTRPNRQLLVVDLVGVVAPEMGEAKVLPSGLVHSYRLLSIQAGSTTLTRLEIRLHAPMDPRFERPSPNELDVVFEGKETAGLRHSTWLAAPVSDAAPATISKVTVTGNGNHPTVQVAGTGRLRFAASRLEDPERLVLDFSNAHLGAMKHRIASSQEPVRRVRLSQFAADVVRVVIDLDRAANYRVNRASGMVAVHFGEAPATTVESAKVQPGVGDLSKMPLPSWLTQNTAALASPANEKQSGAPAGGEPAAAENVKPEVAQQAGAAQKPPTHYTGEPISVNLKDVDLKDFFRLIHEISGLNIVLDPSVRGTLTLVLDEVPWDQALDIVLKNNNLDKQLEGNVLRIATQTTLKQEAETQRDLVKAQAEAVPQVTTTRVLSYTKASALQNTLRKFLSERGEILADDRTNTLIIRDIPSSLPEIDNLIRQLDRKSQQVEIEARVVAASRAFAQDIGTQFGFASSTTGGRSVFGGVTGVGVSPVVRGPGLPLPPLVSGAPGTGGASLPLNTNLGATAPTSGVTFAHASPNFALDFLITMAESKGIGKLLSTPKVITQNNTKGVVKQGTKIPIQTTINNTISVQYIDAVLKLEVTPQITADGTIFMDVVVENTQIDNGIPRVQGIPALATQGVQNQVLVSDGGTVVIGGVMISSQRTDVSQVPLIGSIPVIGHLFKRTAVSVQTQELLFFLTPRIVPNN